MSILRVMIVAAFLALASTHGLAAADEAEAMNRMGILYATGTGVPKDYTAALAWYRRAAENGSTTAMNNIATMYFHGLGVPQSYEEAVKWLRQAIERGDAAAQNKLGAMYEDGLGLHRCTLAAPQREAARAGTG